MEIRLAEPSDLKSITTFDALVGDRLVEIVESRMLVADENGIQGYLSWMFSGCIGRDYINKIVVRPDRRRQGVARALLQVLDRTLPKRVFISAGSRNMAALGFIRATGWTEAGDVFGLLPEGEAESFFYRDARADLSSARDANLISI